MKDRNHGFIDKKESYVEGGLEIFLETITGGNIGQSIMNQEKREQAKMVSIQNLPKSGGSFCKLSIPDCYKKLGIEIIGEYDDLFYKVKLPIEWEIKSHSNSLWSSLLDNKGKERALIFYKVAFYDRSADIVFRCKYTYKVNPEDDYGSDISSKERENGKFFGIVYDAGKEIFRTKGMSVKTKLSKNDNNREISGTERESIIKHYKEKEELEKSLIDQCINFLNESSPNYEDIFAYWDD
jgi:hypothetical protein